MAMTNFMSPSSVLSIRLGPRAWLMLAFIRTFKSHAM